MESVDKKEFIAQTLSNLDFHCDEMERKEILASILAVFCPCCGSKLKNKDYTHQGATGYLQCVCNHLGDELQLNMETPNGDSFRPEMPTLSGTEPQGREYIIETCDGNVGDEIYSGRKVRLIPVR